MPGPRQLHTGWIPFLLWKSPSRPPSPALRWSARQDPPAADRWRSVRTPLTSAAGLFRPSAIGFLPLLCLPVSAPALGALLRPATRRHRVEAYSGAAEPRGHLSLAMRTPPPR